MALGLSNYQFNYRGLRWGPDTVYSIVEINGLEDLNVRVGDRDFPRQQGQIPGQHLAGNRLITIEMEVGSGYGYTADQISPEFQSLVATLSTDQGIRNGTISDDNWDKLTWKEPGLDEVFVRARPVRRRAPRRHDTEFGARPIVFQLRCADPRKYKYDESSVTNQTGTFTVTNNGFARAYPRITYGSYSGGDRGHIINETTNKRMDFDNLVLDEDYLFDMDAYIRGANKPVVTYLGDPVPMSELQPYSRWLLPREPFYLVPGDNEIRISPSDRCSMEWNDTYL